MSDKKISQLTAAATPLTGAEVLPLVQSGVTVKVANNDLRPKQIQSNATSGVLQVTGPAAAAIRVMTTPDANFSAARIDAAQSFTGDQTLSTGNLVIGTAGKGIDFSADANATGMTSELLNDYEEGTWTPAWTNATVGDGTSTGRYTKIGRMVYVEVDFLLGSTSTIGSNAEINNLPFVVNTAFQSFGGGSFTDAGTNTHQASCIVINNTSRLIPTRFSISGAIAIQGLISATQPFTWAVNDRIRLSAVYAVN
jgi:hypothetical protein